MKQISIIFLIFGLVGCGSGNDNESHKDPGYCAGRLAMYLITNDPYYATEYVNRNVENFNYSGTVPDEFYKNAPYDMDVFGDNKLTAEKWLNEGMLCGALVENDIDNHFIAIREEELGFESFDMNTVSGWRPFDIMSEDVIQIYCSCVVEQDHCRGIKD